MTDRTCSIDGCDKAHRARGWCATHWLRWKTHGDPLVTLYPGKSACAVDGCEVQAKSRQWCATHYSRWQRHGDPTATHYIFGDDLARFESYVDKASPEGHWLWTGALTAQGYPIFNSDLPGDGAHRWAYRQWVGPLDPELEIDHVCRVRHCVRPHPDHLEQVTHEENVRRALAARAALA